MHSAPYYVIGAQTSTKPLVAPQPEPTPLPQRHPAAGTRAEARAEEDRAVKDARIIGNQAEEISGLRQQRDDARERVADYETAERTGACVGCLGHQRVIAEMETAARADRKRIAELDLTLRSVATGLAHAQAHRELAAEGA